MNKMRQAYNVLKNRRLYEAEDEEQPEDEDKVQNDPVEEKESQSEAGTNNTAYQEEPIDPNLNPPLKDMANIPVADGQIPQDSSGIDAGKYDPLNPIGNAEIKFNQGNYQTVMGLSKLVGDKTAQLVQTFVPLLEVGLIELLGSTNMYQRQLAQVMPSFNNQGKISFEFTFQYQIQNFIGTDIEIEAIQHDSNYILDKIKPCKANITKCEIDCSNGFLTVMGSL